MAEARKFGIKSWKYFHRQETGEEINTPSGRAPGGRFTYDRLLMLVGRADVPCILVPVGYNGFALP